MDSTEGIQFVVHDANGILPERVVGVQNQYRKYDDGGYYLKFVSDDVHLPVGRFRVYLRLGNSNYRGFGFEFDVNPEVQLLYEPQNCRVGSLCPIIIRNVNEQYNVEISLTPEYMTNFVQIAENGDRVYTFRPRRAGQILSDIRIQNLPVMGNAFQLICLNREDGRVPMGYVAAPAGFDD
ncbi:hypothetical protein CRE_28862 [Caenorhabditis remanei]|uniref:Uncharacterized protein n=1 Tax=Caenorhabditis remanei TaxID=31234 RepID=E3MXI4_CAERE|nr:hypothetical protein CRE_28862 [Caenorhabditis remanei]